MLSLQCTLTWGWLLTRPSHWRWWLAELLSQGVSPSKWHKSSVLHLWKVSLSGFSRILTLKISYQSNSKLFMSYKTLQIWEWSISKYFENWCQRLKYCIKKFEWGGVILTELWQWYFELISLTVRLCKVFVCDVAS